jgi:hypothetical protein
MVRLCASYNRAYYIRPDWLMIDFLQLQSKLRSLSSFGRRHSISPVENFCSRLSLWPHNMIQVVQLSVQVGDGCYTYLQSTPAKIARTISEVNSLKGIVVRRLFITEMIANVGVIAMVNTIQLLC